MRSGFSTSTLRYYEEIGLIGTTGRTAAGYRVYDEHTLDRLAFITRAKQLGCSLDEIADLTRAWDGGECGPVQDRLRALVAAKLITARGQIVELVILTGELQRAAESLELHRPDGPCDERCGCASGAATTGAVNTDAADTNAVSSGTADQPLDQSATQPIVLTRKLAATTTVDETPIACTLDGGAMPQRINDWRAILAYSTGCAANDGSVRVAFADSVPITQLAELVAAEQRCCSFIQFSITVDQRGIGLEAVAPTDALPIVFALLGGPK